MFSTNKMLSPYDETLLAAMQDEAVRQEDHTKLIASENYASPLVMEAGDLLEQALSNSQTPNPLE